MHDRDVACGRREPGGRLRFGQFELHRTDPRIVLGADRVIGAINIYVHGKDVFDEHAAELAELFAAPAAEAVYNAEVLARAPALTDHCMQVDPQRSPT
jgi:hypothetical protein